MGRILIVPFFIPHAGCPFTCVFCNQWQISGREEEDKPEQVAPQVMEYIRMAKEKPERVETAFFGGSFTGLAPKQQEQWLGAAYDLKRKGHIDGIRLSTRPDYISGDILERLHRYGVTAVELGVQSLDDGVLRESRRGYTADTVFEATRLIRTYQFELVYQLMLGLPGDTPEKAWQTALRTVRAAPDGVRIYPALILKGSALARWYEEGEYRPWSLEQAVEAGAGWLALFSAHGIKVIRMGLQAAENLCPEHDLIGGPYHPAYGELVESRLMLKQLQAVLDNLDHGGKEVVISFNPRDCSKVTGQKKYNMREITGKYGLGRVVLEPDEKIAGNDLVIKAGTITVGLPRKEFLEKYRISVGDHPKGII